MALTDEQLAELREAAEAMRSGTGGYLPCEQDHGRDIITLLDEHRAFKATLATIATPEWVQHREHPGCNAYGDGTGRINHTPRCASYLAARALRGDDA